MIEFVNRLCVVIFCVFGATGLHAQTNQKPLVLIAAAMDRPEPFFRNGIALHTFDTFPGLLESQLLKVPGFDFAAWLSESFKLAFTQRYADLEFRLSDVDARELSPTVAGKPTPLNLRDPRIRDLLLPEMRKSGAKALILLISFNPHDVKRSKPHGSPSLVASKSGGGINAFWGVRIMAFDATLDQSYFAGQSWGSTLEYDSSGAKNTYLDEISGNLDGIKTMISDTKNQEFIEFFKSSIDRGAQVGVRSFNDHLSIGRDRTPSLYKLPFKLD